MRSRKSARHPSDLHVSDRGQDRGLDKDNSSIHRKNSIFRRFIPWASEDSSALRSQGSTEARTYSLQCLSLPLSSVCLVVWAPKTPLPQPDEILKILKAIKDPMSRSEVLSLRGSRAARFGSAIHRVCQHFPPDEMHLTNLYSTWLTFPMTIRIPSQS